MSMRGSVTIPSASPLSLCRPTTSAERAASTAPFAHRSRFVHHERSAQEILTVAVLNGAIGFLIVAELGKSETARIARELIPNNLH